MHHQHVRHAGDQDHRREVLHVVVGHLRVQAGVDRVGADGAHQQRVAVGCALGDELAADVAAGARAVVDDDLLAPRLRQLLRRRRGPGCRWCRRRGTARRCGSACSDTRPPCGRRDGCGGAASADSASDAAMAPPTKRRTMFMACLLPADGARAAMEPRAAPPPDARVAGTPRPAGCARVSRPWRRWP